jgi:23S rRNA (adenine1618-N6)-methyltransferase
MIPRRLDFENLCLINSELSQFYDREAKKYDFSNHIAVIKLTETLIKLDLGYSIKLSDHYLCPNYFNRLDYVLFIKNLLDLTVSSSEKPVFGFDIGTSQSCIYPLLCTKYILNLSKMIGTDIVSESIELATKNIQQNNLENLIELVLVDKSQNLFQSICKEKENNSIVFTMCNPPFYSSKTEMISKFKQKPNFVKTGTIGTEPELITIGGDFNFVMKLIKDSKSYKNEVTWFTSLIGNHSSLVKLLCYLKKLENEVSYGVHRFQSGSFTTRWILFWTFHTELKPPVELYNYQNSKFNSNKYVKNLRNDKSNEVLKSSILEKLDLLPYLSLSENPNIVVSLPGNVFSRSYRRTKSFQKDGSVYTFEIQIELRKVIWRSGYNFKIFESFVNVINSL